MTLVNVINDFMNEREEDSPVNPLLSLYSAYFEGVCNLFGILLVRILNLLLDVQGSTL